MALRPYTPPHQSRSRLGSAANIAKPPSPRQRGPRQPGPVQPRTGLPRRGGVLYDPYPVFDRVATPPLGREADDNASGASPRSYDLTWFPPEALATAEARTEPGLFIIERRSGAEWLPVHLGMSVTGIGHPLRWISSAPAILGLRADWNAVRVRAANIALDSSKQRDRAVLRALRDETAATISQRAGSQARLFVPPVRSPGSDEILSQISPQRAGTPPAYLL
jgi:hypothetical protein